MAAKSWVNTASDLVIALSWDKANSHTGTKLVRDSSYKNRTIKCNFRKTF